MPLVLVTQSRQSHVIWALPRANATTRLQGELGMALPLWYTTLGSAFIVLNCLGMLTDFT